MDIDISLSQIMTCMPTCPECGHSESDKVSWGQRDRFGTPDLVVCPNCDTVLGGLNVANLE